MSLALLPEAPTAEHSSYSVKVCWIAVVWMSLTSCLCVLLNLLILLECLQKW